MLIPSHTYRNSFSSLECFTLIKSLNVHNTKSNNWISIVNSFIYIAYICLLFDHKITPDCLYQRLPVSTHATRERRRIFKGIVHIFRLSSWRFKHAWILRNYKIAKVTFRKGNIVKISPIWFSTHDFFSPFKQTSNLQRNKNGITSTGIWMELPSTESHFQIKCD